MDIEMAARAAHEVNRAYAYYVCGDNSHLPWKDVPEAIREGVRAGARAIADAPTLTAAEIHGKWMARKLDEGWVYGETKSYERRTHPCLLPYNLLPLFERVKDEIFCLVVRAQLGLD